ncbi:MAG: DNA polymerase IV [Oscillospiraceae bacterium]|nr:DNA polymerase IV [Oscillospiraceae bacterium]MBR2896798.1 DNA polymerase IV [Oscillospiraceae bacterium]MBR2978194.1 DNA polymerase IV [Oscillospiraceae bacterium]
MKVGKRIIFHVDVNSAFLSWSAVHRLEELGEETDLRTIPSVVADERDIRRSIVLAKSTPAKKYGVKTGEPLGMAREKCPQLAVVPPDYELYVTASRGFIRILREFSPLVEQYSIDEAWVDMTGTTELFGPPVLAAEKLKNRIRDELGFTVNVGISTNKLLAKMAGDFEKPDKVHTLFPEEIREKLWPLPVRDLFSVGPATERKLRCLGISTIGQLAQAEPELLRQKLHKPGLILWHFANGRSDDALLSAPSENKSYGNSMTTPWDVTTAQEGKQVLLSLCETVATRLRRDGKRASLIGVCLRSTDFHNCGRQMTLQTRTNATEEIYHAACRVFDLLWDGKTPLRQLGVSVGKVTAEQAMQRSIFDAEDPERLERMDAAVDAIRAKYGEDAILRARLMGGVAGNMAGGLSKHRRSGVTKPLPEEGK